MMACQFLMTLAFQCQMMACLCLTMAYQSEMLQPLTKACLCLSMAYQLGMPLWKSGVDGLPQPWAVLAGVERTEGSSRHSGPKYLAFEHQVQTMKRDAHLVGPMPQMRKKQCQSRGRDLYLQTHSIEACYLSVL
jgi:hypothetical protein